jgi:hypothetical protein
MRLRIIDTNFTTKFDWIFKLTSESGINFYIMNEQFYKNHNLEGPITKKELDYYDRGLWISSTAKEIDGKFIVVSEN